MNKEITAVLVGAGNRANRYSMVSYLKPGVLKIVGIVDPDPIRRELMRDRYHVPLENCFDSVDEFIKRDTFADIVINGTMDHLHVPTSIPVLKKGYDLLLEKPFALNETEMNELVSVAKAHDRKVVIGHVLRYADFYKAIHKHVTSGEIGEIISIEMCEHVSYHHMAVSFVRGKWRSEKLCFAPMLLAKCCHDIDILLWMLRDTEPVAVASFGDDFQFGKDRKPENAGNRCMADCSFVDECPFSAKTNYLPPIRWKQYVWKCLEGEGEVSQERMAESLRTDNPYGECVWNFERDGNVDHQTCIFKFANGATGTFTLVGGCSKAERNIHIVGTKGEIKGTFEDSRYVVRKIAPTNEKTYVETVYDLHEDGDKVGAQGGHGNGDHNLVYDFLDYLNGEPCTPSCATLEDSARSHRAVFKAVEAMKTGTVVTF